VSETVRNQDIQARIPDTRWKDLYRIGTVACIAFPVTIVLAVIAYLFWPYTPGFTSVAEIYATLQESKLAGLVSFDLSVVILMPIMIPQLLATYAALKRVNESYAMIALVLGLMGVVLWLAARPLVEMVVLSDQYAAATSDAARSQTLAAGEALSALFNGTMWVLSQFAIALSYTISALLMLRSRAFGRATAYVGLGLSVFGYLFWIPVIGPILSLLGTVGGVVWYVLLARDLYHLGWKRGVQSASVIN
jgi:hypothetical protein